MRLERDQIIILIADDDTDYRMLTEDAYREAQLTNEIHFVKDGKEMIDVVKVLARYWFNIVKLPPIQRNQ